MNEFNRQNQEHTNWKAPNSDGDADRTKKRIAEIEDGLEPGNLADLEEESRIDPAEAKKKIDIIERATVDGTELSDILEGDKTDMAA